MMTTLARYVYVYLEGDDRTLTLCELEVYGQRGMHHIFLNIRRNIFPLADIDQSDAFPLSDSYNSTWTYYAISLAISIYFKIFFGKAHY